MKIIIEKFSEHMADTVAKVIELSITSSHQEFYSSKEIENICKDYSPAKISEKAKNRDSFVLTTSDQILGYGSIKKDKIKGIYIHPSHFGKGLGSYILKHLEAVAIGNDIKIVQLYSSLNALKFYLSHGYVFLKDWNDDNGPSKLLQKTLGSYLK